jgi:hypothetical protein
MMSFDDMVKTILERGKVSRDELMSKIRQKQEELSGFITSEGAAIIVGRELGVEFGRKEPEVRELTIDDLTFLSFLRLYGMIRPSSRNSVSFESTSAHQTAELGGGKPLFDTANLYFNTALVRFKPL